MLGAALFSVVGSGALSDVAVTRGTLGATAIIGIPLGMIFLLSGGEPAALPLPVGLPGYGLILAIDGISGLFLLLLFVACGAAALLRPSDRAAASAGEALSLAAGTGLTLLAGDSFLLLLGVGLIAAALRLGGRGGAGLIGFSLVALAAALTLLAAQPGLMPQFGFPAIRGAGPAALASPWGGAAFVLTLLGAGCLSGLLPFHAVLPVALRRIPASFVPLSGAVARLGVYLLIRLLLDLPGAAPPLWWGSGLILLAAGSAVIGAIRATDEGDLQGVIGAVSVLNSGVATVGIGVALLARAADLPLLATLALGGGLLQVLGATMGEILLALGTAAVERGAGTRRLDRLGGLIHAMPRSTACLGISLAGIGFLPPGIGFAAAWMILEALLAAPRAGGFAVGAAVAVGLALLALALGLAGYAAFRVAAIALLGRPRSPRAAAAEEAPPGLARTMQALAAVTLVLGLAPAAGLALIASGPRELFAASTGGQYGWWGVAPAAELPGYLPLPLLALFGVIGAGLVWLARIHLPRPEPRGMAWDGGFAAPPPWLPFGDPLTQYSPASMAAPVAAALALPARTADASEADAPHGLAGPVLVGLRRAARNRRRRVPRRRIWHRAWPDTPTGALALLLAVLLLLIAAGAWSLA